MKGRVLKVLEDEDLESLHLDLHSYEVQSSVIIDQDPDAKSPSETFVKMTDPSPSNSHLMSSVFSYDALDFSSLLKELPAAASLEPRFRKLIDRNIDGLLAACNRIRDLVSFASARQKVMATNKLVGLIEQLGKEKVDNLDDRTLARALSLPKYTIQQYEIRLSKLLLKQALKMRPCKDNLLTIFDDKAFAYDLRSRQTTAYRSNVFELSSGITLLNTGTIVITGGFNHPRKCWYFDIKRQKIKTFSNMNEGRGSHCSLILDNLLYVIGGRNERGQLLASTEIWDGQTWQQGALMNSGREGASAVMLRGRIYVFGGSGDELLDTGEVYENNTWNKLDYKLPEALSAVGLVAVSNSHVLIAGGYTSTGLSKAIYEVRVSNGKCRKVGDLKRGDIFKSAGFVHDSKVLLLGSLGVHSIKEDWSCKFKPYKQ